MKLSYLLCTIPLLLAATPADLKSGKYGALISEKAAVRVSSTSSHDTPETHLNLVSGDTVPCAFHTSQEKQPWVVLKLERPSLVRAVEILNRQDGSGFREASLAVSLSMDGKTWKEIWNAGGKAEDKWIIPVADGAGEKAAYIKLGLTQEKAEFFHLSRVSVYGK